MEDMLVGNALNCLDSKFESRQFTVCFISLWIIQQGPFLFSIEQMTKDVAEGVEYAVMGRRSDTGVEGTEVVAPPQGKRRGRKPGPLYTPEELLARREQKKKEVCIFSTFSNCFGVLF